MEEKLESIDKAHARKDRDDVNNGTFRDDDVEERKKVLDDLETALENYREYRVLKIMRSLKKSPGKGLT